MSEPTESPTEPPTVDSQGSAAFNKSAFRLRTFVPNLIGWFLSLGPVLAVFDALKVDEAQRPFLVAAVSTMVLPVIQSFVAEGILWVQTHNTFLGRVLARAGYPGPPTYMGTAGRHREPGAPV